MTIPLTDNLGEELRGLCRGWGVTAGIERVGVRWRWAAWGEGWSRTGGAPSLEAARWDLAAAVRAARRGT